MHGASWRFEMNSKDATTASTGRNVRAALVALAFIIALTTMTGCFDSPRANYTMGGAALGAGAGALLGSSEGVSPATGALVGGLGGGAVGYLVGTEMQDYYGRQYYGRGYSPYYYGGW
jgi:osmotically inducible lipoprotein OsmB